MLFKTGPPRVCLLLVLLINSGFSRDLKQATDETHNKERDQPLLQKNNLDHKFVSVCLTGLEFGGKLDRGSPKRLSGPTGGQEMIIFILIYNNAFHVFVIVICTLIFNVNGTSMTVLEERKHLFE